MNLHVNGQDLPVAQMGPDYLILKEAIQLPPSGGLVTLNIDGKVQRFEVNFPNGISSNQKRVMVKPSKSVMVG
jgi:hypothetical protein